MPTTQTEWLTADIDSLAAGLRKRSFSSVELTQFFLKRIATLDPKIKAYLTVTEKEAMAAAAEADRRLAKQENLTPLTGIPLGIKDVLVTEGVRTTCASKILEHFIPPYSATCLENLKAAGAISLGKLNMDEFAMGSSTENSAYFVTRNPWDLERIPGGSSGGSAAAVAGRLCMGALGSDTGGSIRQPASHCGIVGIKPTYGRVSRYGLVAFASSLDQVGPMARTVRDTAHILRGISGYDPRDSTSVKEPVPDYCKLLEKKTAPLKGITLGIPKEYVNPKSGGIDPEVLSAFQTAVAALKKLGAEIIDVDMPHSPYAVATYYILAPAEASSNLARYDGVRYGLRTREPKNLEELYQKSRAEGFGREVKRRILIGTYVLSAGYYDAYYLKALKVRALIRRDFDTAFKKCAAIISPVTPSPAFKIGERASDPLEMYLSDIFTISLNLAGLPGLSVPCGFSKGGLPIGLQMMGPAFSEESLFQTAYAYEQEHDWHTRSPKL